MTSPNDDDVTFGLDVAVGDGEQDDDEECEENTPDDEAEHHPPVDQPVTSARLVARRRRGRGCKVYNSWSLSGCLTPR